MAGHVDRAVRALTRLATFGRRAPHGVGTVWRHSLQFRVTVSTLALSSAVVFVLGMVLQNQITTRLIDTKSEAAVAQTQQVVSKAERELATSNVNPDKLDDRLSAALEALTNSSSESQDSQNSAAGAYTPVLAADEGGPSFSQTPMAGPYERVPQRIRSFVRQGNVSTQIDTSETSEGRTTYLIVGAPVTSTVQQVQLYLLFPLTSEQRTVATVQKTLLLGSLVLLVLLAAIANLVTRQVVRPVRRAASAAEEFAGGDLDRRLEVVGEDDLATLAVSYNEMAANIQDHIHQLEEFGRLQRQFTQDVSHELRTPLTTVRMAADVLHASRDEFPAGLSRSAELLVDELDGFETLLNDLLEISRLDSGVGELSVERLDLRPMVQAAVEQTRVIAAESGSSIEFAMPEEAVVAEVDRRRIERVLRNLLGNAIDHSEGYPVRMSMASNDAAVAMTVRDYGVGLHPGEAELVFNRFWRADASRNRHTGGTGLGLAISHEDARLHGGRLEAWGSPGAGSCFRLTLPRICNAEFDESPLRLPPDPPEQPEGDAGSVLPGEMGDPSADRTAAHTDGDDDTNSHLDSAAASSVDEGDGAVASDGSPSGTTPWGTDGVASDSDSEER